MKRTKTSALLEIVRVAKGGRPLTSRRIAADILRSCKVLDIPTRDYALVFWWLGYCDEVGNPVSGVDPIWRTS